MGVGEGVAPIHRENSRISKNPVSSGKNPDFGKNKKIGLESLKIIFADSGQNPGGKKNRKFGLIGLKINFADPGQNPDFLKNREFVIKSLKIYFLS